MEQLAALLDVIKQAIEAEKTVTIKAEEITIKGTEVTLSSPEVVIE
jgi:hypothetical protein